MQKTQETHPRSPLCPRTSLKNKFVASESRGCACSSSGAGGLLHWYMQQQCRSYCKHELKGALNNEDISSSFVELDVPSRDVLVRTVTAEPFSMLGLVLQPRQSLLRTLSSDSLQR